MTDQELKDIVAAVVAELEKSGVDFDYKADQAKDDDLVFVIRGTAPNYQGVTVTWKGLLDIITAQATQAKNDAETAKNTANTILEQVQSKGTDITNFVATSKAELETQKNESVNAVKSVYQTDLNELKGDLVNVNQCLIITKNIGKNLVNEDALIDLDVTGNGAIRKGYNIGILPAGNYVISFSNADGIYYYTTVKDGAYSHVQILNGRVINLDGESTLYIRSNDMTFNITNLQFEFGSTPTTYEKYKEVYSDSQRIVDIEQDIKNMSASIAPIENLPAIPTDITSYLYGDTIYVNGDKYIFNGNSFEKYSITNASFDDEQYFDVVILGGGTGGVASAYPFIGTNYKVALVEKNSALGGVACVGYVSTWIEGLNTPMLENIFTSLKANGKASGDFDKSWLPAKFSTTEGNFLTFNPIAMSEKYENDLSGDNFTIFKNSIFVDYGEAIGGNIKSVIINSNGKTIKINAKYFVDATSDASLVRSVNRNRHTDYFYGRDLRSKYNESIAITSGDIRYLNEPSYFFRIENNYDDSAILNAITTVYRNGDSVVAPSYLKVSGYPFDLGYDKWVNPMYGAGMQGMYKLLSEKHDYEVGMRQKTLEFWKYIKLRLQIEYEKGNTMLGGWHIAFRNYGFVEFSGMISERESYRINCENMLTQNDLSVLATNTSTIIAVGSHNIDIHVDDGFDYNAITNFNNSELKPYGIKYGSILPVGLKNVIVASKCFGASQIANASARIAKVINQLGWVGGNAIKLSLDNNISDLRDVSISTLKSSAYTDFSNRFTTMMSHYNG